MSCNAWESGTIKLPIAEVKKVRDAVRTVVEQTQTLFYDKAQEFWKTAPARAKRDGQVYAEALQLFIYGAKDTYTPKYGLGIPDDLIEEFHEFMSYKGLDSVATPEGHYRSKPRRIQQKDAKSHFGKVTGANFSVHVDNGTITFKGREVRYSASDSHGCDRPREHFISEALWSALARVNWTRGSGGQILGNNEYNEEAGSEYAGAGGSYVVMEWGPKTKKPTRQSLYGW